ncbi:hypothetical protein BD311DRAFT_38186 [Dichomitus squalens]|uniref:Uncharacterized protein n=1 Tax=Dichomitus squalens TaxID=114155 RepID=A0A4Q9ME42_9APHY|nr:hypothetical protein BD311DRAFT_38186 [Dichomitus squalens]
MDDPYFAATADFRSSTTRSCLWHIMIRFKVLFLYFLAGINVPSLSTAPDVHGAYLLGTYFLVEFPFPIREHQVTNRNRSL